MINFIGRRPQPPPSLPPHPQPPGAGDEGGERGTWFETSGTRKKIIHKAQKIHSCLCQGCFSKNFFCRYLQSCCQMQCSMPRICALQASDQFAVGVPHISPGPLNRLNCRFFIHTENNRVLRWIQIQPDNISCFPLKIRVMANTPGTLAVKLNIVFSGKAPYSRQRLYSMLLPESGHPILPVHQEVFPQVLQGFCRPFPYRRVSACHFGACPQGHPSHIGGTDLSICRRWKR